MRCYVMAFALVGAMAGGLVADDLPPAKDQADEKQLEEKASYALGFQMGFVHRKQAISINIEALIKGMRDALAGKQPAFMEEELNNAMAEHRKAARTRVAKKNKEEGDAFLKANEKKEGVVTLESGLQYMVLKSGEGPSPGPEDRVKAHYKGTFLDGMEFDGTRDEPATFALTEVIDGWIEALQLMKVGDKWRLFVPSKLAYGIKGLELNGVLVIPPNAVLIFEVELVGIEP